MIISIQFFWNLMTDELVRMGKNTTKSSCRSIPEQQKTQGFFLTHLNQLFLNRDHQQLEPMLIHILLNKIGTSATKVPG